MIYPWGKSYTRRGQHDRQVFLNSLIAERMQMHYSTLNQGDVAGNKLAESLELEEKYTQTLETLPDAARETIEDFVQCLYSKAANEETFFYKKGVKDGLLLYKLLTNL